MLGYVAYLMVLGNFMVQLVGVVWAQLNDVVTAITCRCADPHNNRTVASRRGCRIIPSLI